MHSRATTRLPLSRLWAIAGAAKNIDCFLYHDGVCYVLSVERGQERDVVWTCSARSLPEALTLSSKLRTGLLRKGWRIIHVEEEHLVCAAAV